MKGTLKIKIGNNVLELQGEGDAKSLIKNFSFWSALPQKCGACGDANISLSHRAPGGNDYYGLRCNKCSADLNFGQHKTGGGFFVRQDAKWEIYKPGKNEEDNSKGQPADESSF